MCQLTPLFTNSGTYYLVYLSHSSTLPFSLPPAHSTGGRWGFGQGRLRPEQDGPLRQPGGGSGVTFHLPLLWLSSLHLLPDSAPVGRFHFFSRDSLVSPGWYFSSSLAHHVPAFRPCLPSLPCVRRVCGRRREGSAESGRREGRPRPPDPGERRHLLAAELTARRLPRVLPQIDTASTSGLGSTTGPSKAISCGQMASPW